MHNLKEDELEFISVSREEENEMSSTYIDPSVNEPGNNSAIGNWFFNQSKHPVTVFFHLFFKSAALFLYIFGSWFSSNFIFLFVICILLLAFDFWTVKNVSGRLLVGLRWWSYVKEDGSTEWTFESLEDMAEIATFDANIFWGALYLTPLIWILLFVVGLLRLKFEYLPVVIVALLLCMANIYGYMKCSSNAKERMKSFVEQGIKQTAMSALDNSSVNSWIFNTLLAVTTNRMNGGGDSTASSAGASSSNPNRV